MTLAEDCFFVHLTKCPPAEGAKYSVSKEPKIDTFFHNDYIEYEQELMGNTYAYYLKANDANQLFDNTKPVAAFTIANSALVMDLLQSARKNKINQGIPRVKQRRQYPALLICQLAVFDEFTGNGLGDELLNAIKDFALILNETTACHYLIVEAVNKPKVLDFYQRNDFITLYSSEEIELEKTHRKIDDNGRLKTRLMMYDMMLSMPTEE